MTRTAYAARTLLRQIGDRRNYDVKFGDPDGLGVVRGLRFDKRTSKWLAPLLDEMNDDRIEEVYVTEAGYLHVNFVADRKADDRRKFPLDEAATVIRSAEEGPRSEEQ